MVRPDAEDQAPDPPHSQGDRARGVQPLHHRDPRWVEAGHLLDQPARCGRVAELAAADAHLPRGGARPPPAGKRLARGGRAAAAAQGPGQLRLRRRLGALCRTARGGDGDVCERPAGPHRPAARRPPESRAAGARLRPARPALEPRAGGRLFHSAPRRPGVGGGAGGRALLHLAGPSLRLHAGQDRVPTAQGPGP